ncbi:MAG: hypothetical protein J2P36_34880 [Ktedonobacteraceae bacterium]|nr:hypothetical protein [Ktedonobacteraceae bacterium]
MVLVIAGGVGRLFLIGALILSIGLKQAPVRCDHCGQLIAPQHFPSHHCQ